MGSAVFVTIVDAAVAGPGPRASVVVRDFGFLDFPNLKRRFISLDKGARCNAIKVGDERQEERSS